MSLIKTAGRFSSRRIYKTSPAFLSTNHSTGGSDERTQSAGGRRGRDCPSWRFRTCNLNEGRRVARAGELLTWCLKERGRAEPGRERLVFTSRCKVNQSRTQTRSRQNLNSKNHVRLSHGPGRTPVEPCFPPDSDVRVGPCR